MRGNVLGTWETPKFAGKAPAVFWNLPSLPRRDQHQLAASVDEDGVELQPHRVRRLERGCQQASCVLGPIAEQRFGRELEHAVADNGDLDGAEL